MQSNPLIALAIVLVSSSAPVLAQGVPPGYYNSVDTSTAAALRSTLHAVIDDHTRFPYTSSSTDTWNVLEDAQENPANSSQILDIYRNANLTKQGGGNSLYNREHSWPRSYGFPDDGSSNYPFTDCHALFLSDPGYNSTRANKPFSDCASGCSELPTVSNDGLGGSGDSNFTEGSFTTGSWQTWSGRQGDIARAMLYFDVRYEGGFHGVTGVAEPDLILTDNVGLIDSGNTGNNESVAYMGLLSHLLAWHAADPPDDFERRRNDVVASYQGNRNPFVDHPEWADCIFEDRCGAPDPETFTLGASTFSVGSGGLLAMNIDVGPSFAGQAYWILGSLSGSAPGFALPPFSVPLNIDFYFNLSLSAPNMTPFIGSLGALSATGTGSAFFLLSAGAAAPLVGLDVSHAAVVFDPVTAALLEVTNAAAFALVP